MGWADWALCCVVLPSFKSVESAPEEMMSRLQLHNHSPALDITEHVGLEKASVDLA